MCEFYGSLATDGIRWTAQVRGVEISITLRTISRVWEISLRGLATNCVGDRDAVFRCILEQEDVRGVSSISTSQLSMEMRVLHHIIALISLQKTGMFDFIIERELVVMVTLTQRTAINLPTLIVH